MEGYGVTEHDSGTINTELIFVAYEEFKDETRKSDVVKNGVYTGEDTVEFGASVSIKDPEVWGYIVKEGYRLKMREILGTDFIYEEDIMEDIRDLGIFKTKEFQERVHGLTEKLNTMPIRVALSNKNPETVEDRREIVEGFKYLNWGEPNTRGVVYENSMVKIQEYETVEDVGRDMYPYIVGTNIMGNGVHFKDRELLQDAFNNKMNGTLDKKDDVINYTYVNFKDEYEGILGTYLSITADIKLIGLKDSVNDSVELEGLVKPIDEINQSINNALQTGVLSMDKIVWDNKGDIIVEDKGDSIIKLKVFIPNEGDTVFRVTYNNDKRKTKFGKIKDVVSVRIGKDFDILEDKDEYLKYIGKLD